MNDIVFRGEDGTPVTTSLKVAEVFGKKHFHVLRDIESLECSKEFLASNFGFMFNIRELPNGGSRKEPFYNITRDGFTILVMGYTGKKAMEFKEQYIAAFNAMEKALRQGFQQSINALTRKQLAEMVLAAENEKEELMQRVMDAEAELDDLKNNLAARVLRLEQRQPQTSAVLSYPTLASEKPQSNQPEFCSEGCVYSYSYLRKRFPQYVTVKRAANLFRRRGLNVDNRDIFRFLRQEGYVCSDEMLYHCPSRKCVDRGWMVCSQSGSSSLYPGRRYFVPRLSPDFVDVLERLLKSQGKEVLS